MVNNFKYLNWIGTGILVSLAVITTSVVVAQDDTINPVTSTNWQELSKTVIDLPEGDTRPLVALAAIAGNAKGVFTGRIVKEMNQKMGSKVNIEVKGVRLEKQVQGCPVVELTIHDTEHPNIAAEKFQMKACPANKPQ